MPDVAFDFAPAYRAEGWGAGIAWRAYALETEADEDTDWTGIEEPTGMILAYMIGDDRTFVFDPSDLVPIADDDYCTECGQIGCTADGRSDS